MSICWTISKWTHVHLHNKLEGQIWLHIYLWEHRTTLNFITLSYFRLIHPLMCAAGGRLVDITITNDDKTMIHLLKYITIGW